MKKLLTVFAFVCLALGLPLNVHAQNLTTVSGSNITDINGARLAAGQLCFLITDQQDNPISVSIGGGGQALKRGYCSTITSGVVASFTVPNPASTLPSGIYYRVTVKDSSTGQEVLRYTQVSFTGAAFNFDNYAPLNLGTPAPLSGNSVTGNLSVTGNVAATGTVTGTNIPGAIPGAGACTNQFVTVLNTAAPPTCSNTIGGVFSITGSANLGTIGTNGQTAGGFGTPSAIRHYCGDGTGWRCEFAKRIASIDTIEAWITDGGVFNVATGYQLSGGAPSGNVLRGNGTNFVAAQLAATDLSNGVTGSGAAVLATSPSLITPAIGSAGAAFAGSTSGTITLKAAAVATGTVTLPAINDQLVTRTSTDTLTNKTLTSSVLTSPTINVGISQGAGFKHQRFGPPCTPVASAGSICITNYTWTTAFADASYTASCGGINPGTGTGTVAINSLTATTVQIIITSTGLANTYSGIDCIAIHD